MHGVVSVVGVLLLLLRGGGAGFDANYDMGTLKPGKSNKKAVLTSSKGLKVLGIDIRIECKACAGIGCASTQRHRTTITWKCPGKDDLSLRCCQDGGSGRCWLGTDWTAEFECSVPGTLEVKFENTNKYCSLKNSGTVRLMCPRGYRAEGRSCERCDIATSCSGRADAVDSYKTQTSCRCSCDDGYEPSIWTPRVAACSRCSRGYVKDTRGQCLPCTVEDACSGQAFADKASVTNTGQCTCLCKKGYKPSTVSIGLTQGCSECDDGYYDFPSCKPCNDADTCQGRGSASLDAMKTACTCKCRNWFTGDTCGTCPQQYKGAECDECAAGYIFSPLGCTPGPGCTCELCTEAMCSHHAVPGGVTTSNDNSACVCICADSWTGERCEKCLPQYNATCNGCAPNRKDYPTCSCIGQYTGPDCMECAPQYNATCNGCAANRKDYPTCSCVGQYTGALCTVCSPQYNAMCNGCAPNRKDYPTCSCIGQYTGALCMDCAPQYNASCTGCANNREKYPVCSCVGQFYGENCELCSSIYNASCTGCAPNRKNYPTCECVGQFFGPECTDCAPRFNASCTGCAERREKYPTCECADQWSGPDCSHCAKDYNDTCNGCRYVPDILMPLCLKCSDKSQLMLQSGTCVQCPEGLKCDGALVVDVASGWWRAASTLCDTPCEHLDHATCAATPLCTWSADDKACRSTETDGRGCGDPVVPTKCYSRHCRGSIDGAPSGSACMDGSHGPMCGMCDEGYVLSDTRCHKCGGAGEEVAKALLTLLGALLLPNIFVYFNLPRTIREKPLFLRLLKQFMTHLQVIAMLISLQLPWGVLEPFIVTADAVAAAGSTPTPILCLHPSSTLTHKTLVWLVGVPLLIPVFSLIAARLWGRLSAANEIAPSDIIFEYCEICHCWSEVYCSECKQSRCFMCSVICRNQLHQQKRLVVVYPGMTVELRRRTVFVASSIVLYFLVWSTLLRMLSLPLRCTRYEEPDGSIARVNEVDPRVGCHGALAAASLVGLLVHGVAAPIALAVVLFKLRRHLGEFEVAMGIGFLYCEYRRRTYWWEAAIILRKGLLIAILTSLQDVEAKVTLMTVVIAASLVLTLLCTPFRSRIQQTLEIMSLVVLLKCMIVAQLIQYRDDNLSHTLLIVSVGGNALYLLTFLWTLFTTDDIKQAVRRAVGRLSGAQASQPSSEAQQLEEQQQQQQQQEGCEMMELSHRPSSSCSNLSFEDKLPKGMGNVSEFISNFTTALLDAPEEANVLARPVSSFNRIDLRSGDYPQLS